MDTTLDNDIAMADSAASTSLYLFDLEECQRSGVLVELQKYFRCSVHNDFFLQRPLVTALVDEEELPRDNVRNALLNNSFVRNRCLLCVWPL
jgi:hypothetical protein